MKTLITGGNGLVGSSFKNGYKLNSSECDLRNAVEVKKLFELYKPDYVVHTAAKVGGIGANINYPATFFYDNLMMNTNIIHYASEYNVKKLVCFLSTCIFPDKVDYPIDETKIELGPPSETNYAYAYAKRMADVQIKSYNTQFSKKFFSVIPTNIYGKNDNYHLGNGHVIPMLIHKCYLAKKNNTPFEVWGTGTPLREFIYADDVSNIINLLLEKYDETTPVIITNSTEYSIKTIVNLIVEFMQFEGEVIWLTDKPDGQYRKPSSNKKLLSIIGDYKFTPIEIGLKKSIEWFIDNYENIRK